MYTSPLLYLNHFKIHTYAGPYKTRMCVFYVLMMIFSLRTITHKFELKYLMLTKQVLHFCYIFLMEKIVSLTKNRIHFFICAAERSFAKITWCGWLHYFWCFAIHVYKMCVSRNLNFPMLIWFFVCVPNVY